MTPELQHDPEHHVYRVNGRWAPGVTRILSDLGYYKGKAYFTEESRLRGKQAHLACQLADQYCPDALTLDAVLDVLDVAEPLIPYLQGYLLFKKEKRYRPIWSEKYLYMKNPLVCGTVDSWGTYGNRKALVDLKSWRNNGPTPKPSAVLQTAGYKLMVKERLNEDTDVRVIVALPGDGLFRYFECTDERDEFTFQCAAYVWWHRWENKLIERSGASEVEDTE